MRRGSGAAMWLLVCSMVLPTVGAVSGCAGGDGSDAAPSATPRDGVAMDGTSWTRVADPDAVFGTPEQEIVRLSHVAAGGPGYVAVGTYGQGQHGEHGTVAAAWTSEDGSTWERVPHDDAVFGGFGPGRFTAASAVTTGGPGLVAVGVELDAETLVAVAWLSEDGEEWTRVEVDDPRSRGATDLDLHAIVDSDEGMVAVGIERGGPAGAPEYPAAWRSSDGVDWKGVTLAPAAEAAAWGYLSTVVAHDGQVIAAGAIEGPDGRGWVATVWHGTAAEGLTRIPHDDEVFGHDDNATMYDVAVTSSGLLVAVGERVPGPDGPTPMRFIGTVWTSPDGLTWTRLADEDGTFSGEGHTSLASITDGPHGLVAVGEVGAGEGSTIGAAWTSR